MPADANELPNQSLACIAFLTFVAFGGEGGEVGRSARETLPSHPPHPRTQRQAFNYLAGDFEDALQISAAVASKADHILTNDVSGFTKSPISVLSPKDFLLMLASGD